MARRTLLLIVIVAALVAAAAFWAGREAPRSGAPGQPLASVTPARHGGPVPPSPPVAATATTSAATTAPPPGLTAEQWATVEAQLAGQPQAAAERERLRDYFTWSDAVQRWRAAQHDAALARAVDAGLPERLARDEVSVPEALLLKTALLQALEPDEAARTAALQTFRDALPQASGPSATERDFQQRQAAVVAAWQAQPAAQRDPAALQRQLEALRRQHFSTKETSR